MYISVCRYILMDWLAEVTTIKFFSSITLHVAISVIDRFLKRQRVTRSRLQLLGVAAMVLCSRSVEQQTVVWFTVRIAVELWG